MLKKLLNLPFAFVILFIGGAMIWFSPNLRVQTEGFVTAQGQVIALEPSTRRDSNALYPVVEFRDATGQIQRFRSSAGANPPAYRVAQPVEVIYNPAAPTNAYINTDWDINGGAIIVSWIGWVFAGFGALMLLGSLSALLQLGALGALLRKVVR
jgi:hypothetical protein